MEQGVQLPAVTFHPCAYVSPSICCKQRCYHQEIRLTVQYCKGQVEGFKSTGTQLVLHSNATDIVESENTVMFQRDIEGGVATLYTQKPGYIYLFRARLCTINCKINTSIIIPTQQLHLMNM